MSSAAADFRVLATVSEYTRFYGLPAPRHPLLTVVDLAALTQRAGPALLAAAQTPVRQQLYVISLKRHVPGVIQRYGRQAYDFHEGVLRFTAPGQVSWWVAPDVTAAELAGYEQTTGWMLIFHPDLVRAFPLAQKLPSYAFFSYQVHEALHLAAHEETQLAGLLDVIRREYEQPLDAFSHEVLATQLEVLCLYANRFYQRQFRTRRTGGPDVLSRFEKLLRSYFQAGPSALPTVLYFAEALHVSPAYLSDLLRTHTGLSTQQHLQAALVEEAKRLLCSTKLSVKETAFQLGFDYPHYFNRFFKRQTGLTPAAFRLGTN